tara:strand:+ start:113 stop:547 length:435 start_codon:yes stop_codon:yes gene_type:complete
MSYSIEELQTYLASIELNDNSEIADKEVQAILSKSPENNPLSKCTKPKPMHITKTKTYMPQFNLPSPKLKSKNQINVLSKRDKKAESKKEDSFILGFIKKENQSRNTQEMRIKKRKLNNPFYVKMEPFKMKNKKFKKSVETTKY